MWHEDFGDEPSVEERIPFGIPPEEMAVLQEDAILQCNCCACCGQLFDYEDLIETGMREFYTMDLDPGLICCECLESRRVRFIPDNPLLFDVYTPVEFV